MADLGGSLKPGDDVADKYTIEATIGVGGMGVVYRARHRRLSQGVAIKMLLPSMLVHPTIVARFEREARAAGQLRSRHTARVIDVGELPDGGPFMVMELLHGQDLGAELEQRGPLPIGEAVEWVVQACSAMAEAHERGIVHRDLKPANLFLAEEEDGRVLKVLDFGISKVEDASGSGVTSTQTTMGTPLYMSPEQVRSTKDVDLRTDIWSLGVILYELLTGRTPFEGAAAAVGAAIVSDEIPPLESLRKDVPAELAAAISRALTRNRDDRFPDARSLAAAIAPWSRRASNANARASANQTVEASEPHLVARTGDAMRAPTMAAEDPRDPLAASAVSEAATSSRRTRLVAIVALGALTLAGSAVLFARSASNRATLTTVSPSVPSSIGVASAPPSGAPSAAPATAVSSAVSSAPVASVSVPVATAPARPAARPPAARLSAEPTTKSSGGRLPPAGENPIRL